MLNVRLACDHLFGKLLFTWLSLVMSMMVSFVLSFFPRDVLDEILNLIESVSEDFPSYSFIIFSKGCLDLSADLLIVPRSLYEMFNSFR